MAPAAGVCKLGKPCWKNTLTGYKYLDGDQTPDGLYNVTLTAGTMDKQKLLVTGKGSNLHLPPPVGTTLLTLDSTVTVQLVRTDGGVCWEAVYPGPAKRNLMPIFRDTLP